MEPEDEFLELIRRGRGGFQAFAATIDLLGIGALMVKRPSEARARLDDLHQGFGESLAFYPGGEVYRVCFAGDSIFIVRELEPHAEAAGPWASFCGHVFALAGFLHDMETNFGNPGLRVVLATGPLFQLREPESWRRLPWSHETQNWFVLTGASVALKKCTDAEAGGKDAGFVGGYCWHDKPGVPGAFLGTSLRRLSPETYGRPGVYPEIYTWMVANADKQSDLSSWKQS